MVRNVLKLDVMFELLLFLYLLPVMVIAVLLFNLVVWTISKMFGLAVWLVRTLFALLWRGLVTFTLMAVNRPPDRREER